jgi:hypothetical protein
VRYFFHLRIGEELSPDEIGLEMPDLETAYLQAFEAAQAMWGELLAERCDPLIRAFEIADEHGRVLLQLPFSEVLERARKPTRPLPKLPEALKNALQERKVLLASLREQIRTARSTIDATRTILGQVVGTPVRRSRSR